MFSNDHTFKLFLRGTMHFLCCTAIDQHSDINTLLLLNSVSLLTEWYSKYQLAVYHSFIEVVEHDKTLNIEV